MEKHPKFYSIGEFRKTLVGQYVGHDLPRLGVMVISPEL